jgi:hypothetical protein
MSIEILVNNRRDMQHKSSGDTATQAGDADCDISTWRIRPGMDQPQNRHAAERGFSNIAAVLLLLTLLATGSAASAAPQQAEAQTPPATESTPPAETASNAAAEPARQPASESVIKSDKTEIQTDPHLLIPIPQRPYRTLVLVSFAGNRVETAAMRRSLVTGVRHSVARVWGQMLDATVRENDWLIPGTVDLLHRVELEDVFERYPEKAWDKVLLVTYEDSYGEFKVAAREYDPRIQELTAVRQAATLDERSLPDVAGRLMRESFRPALFLDTANPGSDELELLLQAGEIIPPDPLAAQIAKGDVLRTFMRHMERRDPTQLKALQRLDLTYVRVTDFNRDLSIPVSGGANPETDGTISIEGQSEIDSDFIDRSHVSGVLISHLPYPPFGARGRNVQQMAVRQRPAADRSSVQLVLNSRTDRPLVCHRVDKVAKLRWREDSELPSVRMVSDRNGRIEIEVDPDHPTFWLYVYSGALLLARVPYAPGLVPEDTIKLPDDSLRLGVEGELYLFRDDLVDIVAQRAVYKSLARKASAAGNLDDLEDAVEKLTELPGKKEFDAKLNAVKQPAVTRADALRNRSARRKIERLCKAMSDSLGDFFSSDKQIAELQEIEKLKEVAKARRTGGTVSP